MYNDKDRHGWTCGTEVVSYRGENWILVSSGNRGIEIETDLSTNPSFREFSAATGFYVRVERVPADRLSEVRPFATILLNAGKDEEFMAVYRNLSLAE